MLLKNSLLTNGKHGKKTKDIIGSLRRAVYRKKPLFDDVHKPYAAGLLVVRPGEELSSKIKCIDSYFSEDYSIILDSFSERSEKVLFDLIERIATIVRLEPDILYTSTTSLDSMGFFCLNTEIHYSISIDTDFNEKE